MSAKYLREDTSRLKVLYNTSQVLIDGELKREHQLFNSYDQPTKERLKKEKFDKVVVEYKEKFNSLAGKVKSEKNDARKKIQNIRFPNLTSKENSLKAFGEAQINTAITFLSKTRTTKEIINEINSAIDYGRLDYASKIISIVMPENILKAYFQPGEKDYSLQMNVMAGKIEAIEKDSHNNLDKEIFEESYLSEGSDKDKGRKKELIESIIKTLDEFPGIDSWKELQNEINELNVVEEILNALFTQINNGENSIGYYTDAEMRSMSLEEVKENLDFVNWSMEYQGNLRHANEHLETNKN